MLRLRCKESHMDISALWHLPMSRLLLESPKLGCPHFLCAVNQPRSYVHEHFANWGNKLIVDSEWQWDQLRIMKVGGNESATKFFQSNGGSAALNSKDPTTKYTSNAATKYKEELKRRAARDATEYAFFHLSIYAKLTCEDTLRKL
jgi:hypothetical protein